MNPQLDADWRRRLGGTGIAIVAPSAYARVPQDLERALDWLRAHGCRVRDYHDPAARQTRFAASDAERIAQLHAAAQDPEVRVVIALRGGYGASRLLPALDFDLLAQSGKLFVGHSDFTAVQMGMLARGGQSIAGPMICDDFTAAPPSEYTLQSLLRCLCGPACQVEWQARDNPGIDLEGRLWGGNLTVLTSLLGTPYLPRIEGGILFVEDINEHPYRVERMLLQWLHSGVLQRQAALVLGDFSGYRLGEYDNGYDFSSMLAFLRATLPIPVVTGLPFGHVRDKASLALGSRARLRTQADAAQLEMSEYHGLARDVA